MINSIVYLSKANVEFSEQQLIQLCHEFALKNKRHNITGFLYYKNGFFLQYIESKDNSVNTLYQSIQKDERHSIIFDITFSEFPILCFPSWQMNWLVLSPKLAGNTQQLFLNTMQFIFKMELTEEDHLSNIKELVLRVRDTVYN